MLEALFDDPYTDDLWPQALGVLAALAWLRKEIVLEAKKKQHYFVAIQNNFDW